MRHNRSSLILGFLLVVVAAAPSVMSHPLGNFSIDHYSHVRLTPQDLRLRYVIDMAEIPTFQELQQADADADQRVSTDERQIYVDRTVKSLVSRLAAAVNGTPLSWQVESSNLTAPSSLIPPDPRLPAATLRIVLDLRANLPRPLSTQNHVRYADENYPGRTGWKEIVVDGDDKIRLLRSSASRKDLSRELTQYPPAIDAPPQDVTAEFTFAIGSGPSLIAKQFTRFRDEIYISLMVIVAGLGLFLRWRGRRTAGGRP